MASRRTSDTTPVSPATRRTLSTRKASIAPAATRVSVTPEARHAMIAESAYLRAQARGFSPGRETEDWFAAETEVDALLGVSHGGSPQ